MHNTEMVPKWIKNLASSLFVSFVYYLHICKFLMSPPMSKMPPPLIPPPGGTILNPPPIVQTPVENPGKLDIFSLFDNTKIPE